MSKALILVQLHQQESETRHLISSLRNSAVDLQLSRLLSRAEIEHGYRVRQLRKELEGIYGTSEWNKHLFERNFTEIDCEPSNEPAETAEMAERKLENLYRRANEIVKSRMVQDAASEQTALLDEFAQFRKEKISV